MQTKRILWIDNIRALATTFVVLCHVTESIYSLNTEGMDMLADEQQVIALSMFTLGRLGVPMFFFLSGYLLLDSEYDGNKTKNFYRKRLLPLLCATEIWFLVYQIYNSIFYYRPFSFGECIKTALFLTQGPMTHTWYMPVIIGIYLFVPAVSNALYRGNKLFLIPFGLSFIAAYVVPEINAIRRLKGLPEIVFFLDLSFAGGGYGVGVLLGYVLKKYLDDLRRVPGIIWISASAFLLVLTAWLQWYSYHCGIEYNVWYDCGTLLLAAFSLTVTIATKPREGKVWKLLSKYSFGVYLLHIPILQIVMRCFSFSYNSLLSVGALTISVLTISLLCSALFCKEKHIARVCFFVKK